nr:hypothetical protein [Brevibacillus sp. Leaf182]
MISLLKLRTGHEQRQLLEQISLEDSYILYGNMYLRTDRSVVVTDSAQKELIAIGSYLKGMPFHAFSLHVVEGEENYEVEPMLSYLKEVLDGSLPDGQKGVLALAEPLLTRVQIPNILATYNPTAVHVYEKLGFVTVSSYAFIEFLF